MKYITEKLKELNDDPSKISVYKNDSAIMILLDYSFNPEKKFILPEGKPPFKPDAAPIGMSPANIYQELRRLYVFCRKDLKAIKRESLFVQLLEEVHPSEADLLLAVKDQELDRLYPNITRELVSSVGIVVPKEEPKQAPLEQEPKVKKAPVKKPAPKKAPVKKPSAKKSKASSAAVAKKKKEVTKDTGA